MKRNCIYTNNESSAKDKVIPTDLAGEESHNWANSAPISTEYKESKGADIPSDLEMEINEVFKLLELSRLKVKYYELKLLKLQEENSNRRPPIKKTGKTKEIKKQKDMEKAEVIKNVIEANEGKIEEVLEKRKSKILFSN
jgi:hypothetical protein